MLLLKEQWRIYDPQPVPPEITTNIAAVTTWELSYYTKYKAKNKINDDNFSVISQTTIWICALVFPLHFIHWLFLRRYTCDSPQLWRGDVYPQPGAEFSMEERKKQIFSFVFVPHASALFIIIAHSLQFTLNYTFAWNFRCGTSQAICIRFINDNLPVG